MVHRYFMLHKPVGVVSQFVSSHDVPLLGDLNFSFPEGTHAIGRLDRDSAGLLLLTTDQSVTRRLFQGPVPHRRTYLVDVNGIVTDADLRQLSAGVLIPTGIESVYRTLPCEAAGVPDPLSLFPYATLRNPRIPHSWLQLTLTEGKFHQVRKMVGAVGHACRQLIRTAIEEMYLGNLPPGAVREWTAAEFFGLLRLD